MPLEPCPECGRVTSSLTVTCPYCGFKLRRKSEGKEELAPKKNQGLKQVILRFASVISIRATIFKAFTAVFKLLLPPLGQRRSNDLRLLIVSLVLLIVATYGHSVELPGALDWTSRLFGQTIARTYVGILLAVVVVLLVLSCADIRAVARKRRCIKKRIEMSRQFFTLTVNVLTLIFLIALW